MDIDKLAKDIQRAIESLRSEQEEIDAKIAAMEEALSSLGERGAVVRRGRPRKVAGVAAAVAKSARGRKKPHWSPEARKAAAERMRKYWEDRKGSPKKATKKKATRKKAAVKKRVSKKAAAAAAE